MQRVVENVGRLEARVAELFNRVCHCDDRSMSSESSEGDGREEIPMLEEYQEPVEIVGNTRQVSGQRCVRSLGRITTGGSHSVEIGRTWSGNDLSRGCCARRLPSTSLRRESSIESSGTVAERGDVVHRGSSGNVVGIGREDREDLWSGKGRGVVEIGIPLGVRPPLEG